MYSQICITTAIVLLSSFASLHAETYCMWSVNDPRGKASEAFMKGQCERKEVKGAKNYTEDYSVQGRKFRVEYLGQSNSSKQKIKINGKIGTATEDNRYAKSMNTDDLTIDFAYDEIIPDKSLLLSKLNGIWAREPKIGCKPDKNGEYASDNVIIKGNTLTRYASESQCEIYSLGKPTTSDSTFVLAKCQNEGSFNKEMFSYELHNGGKELQWNGMPGFHRCPR